MGADPEAGWAELLTLKQAALRLGVHYMTVYRYVRQGRLPAERRASGWTIRPTDLDAFDRARAEETYGPHAVDWPGRLARTLVAGDEVAAWSIVTDALAAGASPSWCTTEVISLAMARLEEVPGGDRPAAGHTAGAVALRLTARLGALFRTPGPAGPTVVLGAPSGEHHALAVATLANVLRWARFRVVELGTDVSPGAFVDAAEGVPPGSAVGLSLTHREGLAAAVATCHQLAEALPEVLVVAGGRAVANAELAQVVGAGRWAATPSELIEVLHQLPRAPGGVRCAPRCAPARPR